MSQISDKVGYYVMEIKGQDDIMDTCEYPKGNRKIVVFLNPIKDSMSFQRWKTSWFFTNLSHSILFWCTPESEIKLFSCDTLSSCDKKSL